MTAKIPASAPVESGVGLPESEDPATAVASRIAYAINAAMINKTAKIVIVI